MSNSETFVTFWSVAILTILPVVIHSSAFFSYLGLVKQETLGYFGISRGGSAVIYGAIHALFTLVSFAGFVYFLWRLLNTSWVEIIRATLEPLPTSIGYPDSNIVFAFLGLTMFVVSYLLIKFAIKLKPAFAADTARQAYIKQRFYVMGSALIASAALIRPGMPQGILILIFVFVVYLDPGAKPSNVLRFERR
jgi:hypothetical protein